MRGNNKRRHPPESLIPQPTPDHYRQYSSRDSDASFASSRPSAIGAAGRSSELYTDKSYQSSAVRSINAYLSSHSSLLSLRPVQIPSAKEITEILHFLIQKLDYHHNPSAKIEDDLFAILKSLNCPYKVNKSTLRAPNTPHNWPSYLGVMHWLVQIAMYKEHLGIDSRAFVENNSMLVYALDSYMNYIRGDDDAVDELDKEFIEKLEKERDNVLENVRVLESNFKELEAKLESMKVGPTEKEKLENLRGVLEEDVNKFNAIIAELNSRIEGYDRVLAEKKAELDAKVEEKKRIDVENEELRKRVEEQSFNARDAERMKRELQAVERDIGDAESERNLWEEKIWDLNTEIGHKFKELETLSMDCNQAARRLKLGNEFQYVLNADGSTPAEIMGVDDKSIVKPGLASFADNVKGSSMAKLEEFILLQQELSELTAKIEGKENHIAGIQSHIDEVEAQIAITRNETEQYINRCAVEAQKQLEDVQVETQNLDNLERQAAEILKASELKLQEAMKNREEEIQKNARELFSVLETVSKYKEHTASKISEMKSKLSETVGFISDRYKHSLPVQFGINLDGMQ